MGIFNYIYLGGVKFICNEFNKTSFSDWEKMCNSMISDYENIHGNKSFFQNSSSKERTIGFFISQVGLLIKMHKRHEFRRYTPYDLNRLSKGRFELLAFISVHQGENLFFKDYINNERHLRRDCNKIYDTIKKLAPSAITLDLESFIFEANKTLYEFHPS
jgi:hypothetical protein